MASNIYLKFARLHNLKITVSLIIFAFLSAFSVAQTHIVSGTITDAGSGEPIIGATVLVVSTGNGTITDVEGKYQVETSTSEEKLKISYVGYQALTIDIAGRTSIDVVLTIESNQLDEVVVVGYGRQKKREVTGAIARISSDKINETPTLRVEQALQGRTSGVQVTNQSGQPGDEPTVRIRGIGTTGNARPLYIVDGLAVNGIDYLNPGDIESIDVLKDAASSAIYGARAANGVVLITTKSGKEGKLNISLDAYYGFQNSANTLDMLNADQYKKLMNEGARNAGLTEPFDPSEISSHNTNWQDHLFEKNAPIQNYQLSVVGGSKKSTFASSLSFFSQQGIMGGKKSQFDRYTARLNSKHAINKVISFGNNLAYTHLIKRGIGTNQSFNGAYSSALNLDPLTPVYETDKDILSQYPYSDEPVVKDSEGNVYGISNHVGAEVVNPLALLEIDNDETRKDELVGNVYGVLEPIKGLKLHSSIGVDLAFLLNDGFTPLFFLNGAQLNDNKTSVNKRIERFFTWQWENTLSYEVLTGDHTISGLVGITASEFKYEDLSGFNADVPVHDPDNVYLDLANDTVWRANGGANHSALYSQFGRLNYSYKGKYSLTGIIRRDGSSKFGANNRFGIFPSIGVAWVASEENFLSNLGPINYLKLRASWGVNGNQEIGDYQFVSTINNDRNYTFGGGVEKGSSPLFVENTDIHWEESEQIDIGTDIGLFSNRMDITIDYYVKKTKDLLERISIPAHVGNDGPVANVGSVENKGIEAAINYRNKVGKWKYTIGINGAFNDNKITHIGNTEKVINGASWAIAGTVTRSEEGLPIAYFWGYETDGIFQNQTEVFQHINRSGELLQPLAKPGDVRFKDTNGDGLLDEMDRVMIGDPTPDITFGLSAGVTYKNFDFSLFAQGTQGNDIFNGSQRQDLRFTNRTTAILDRWTGEGTSHSIPRYTWSDINNNYRVSDLYIEDGSHIRLKNIQLGYTLPGAVLEKTGAETWRFYISGENLITLTKYSGADPEIGALSSFDVGIDRGIYPQAKTIRVGTSITF